MSHGNWDTWEFPLSLTVVFLLTALLYVRGWLALRSTSLNAIPGWRAGSFLVGLSSIWAALGSPIADSELLTVHMAQHLLIMTVGAPLILLGTPVKPFLLGLPSFFFHAFVRPAVHRPVRRLARTLQRPVVCWLPAVATLVTWHIPAAFTLAMHSKTWHTIELASFLVTGLLFWLPVVQSERNASTPAGWNIVVYLFLATLPCDALSAFLVFSERVAYPVYLSTPRHSGLSVLEDQQLAGALMWTVVTIVYLAAAAILSTRLLSRQEDAEAAFARPAFAASTVLDDDSHGAEVA